MQYIHGSSEWRLGCERVGGLAEKDIRHHIELVSIDEIVHLDWLTDIKPTKQLLSVFLGDLEIIGPELANLLARAISQELHPILRY